jgi:hypothetical protein
MADFRNHRHHGLIGALVVLPAGATPLKVEAVETSASANAETAWHGARVTVQYENGDREEHLVLLLQDGLRLFLNGEDGKPGMPLKDPEGEEPGEAEVEDQGQKGFNYRTEPIGPIFDPRGSEYTLIKSRELPFGTSKKEQKSGFTLSVAATSRGNIVSQSTA